MLNYLVRTAKRFAVLVPGLVIAYFSVRDVFPVFNRRLPVAVAIFLTYVLGAYVLIPALIRIIRIFVLARHLPVYSVTPDGFASDPVNIGIVGNKGELIAAMKAAGWYVADKHSLKNVLREIISGLFNRSYPSAPMSSLYLLGRHQDIGFELPIPGERGHRHHVRFWATGFRDDKPLSTGSIQWHERKHRSKANNTLWLGAASRDVGFTLIRHNVQVTHMIDPDTNAERELIVEGLRGAKRVASTESIRIGKPYRLINRAWRGSLHSDGRLTIVKLSSNTTAPDRSRRSGR